METPQLPDGIRELPVVARDLALDFANTVDDPLGPERHDHIADYHGLLWWSLRVSLITEPEADRLLHTAAPRPAAAIVRKAHALRDAINHTAGTIADAQARSLATADSRAEQSTRTAPDTQRNTVSAEDSQAQRNAGGGSGSRAQREAGGASGSWAQRNAGGASGSRARREAGGGLDSRAQGDAGIAAGSRGQRADGAGAGDAGVEGWRLEGWEELRPFVTSAVERAELVDLQPTWRFELLDSPLWPVAHAAYELLTSPRAARIKRCAGCPWLFLDQSKNGSRRWCSMEICGTSEKVRLYVTRRAARRSQS
ncbi:CGNR zinc finger domain-containing protein [Kribbella sp. CA-247076]|uniref:CGNR zinc finger domain-containing protein n=1 Tax=Kribbella sp. CA-247076 TaxID=3239941 RepID=UPI003D8E040F